MRRILLATAVVAASSWCTLAALAEPTDADRAAATQLFKDGRSLLEKKQYDLACPKLEESQRLDPGGGTLLNLAICHEGQGRLATAWTEFNEALGLARNDDREDRVELARARIEALEPKLSRLAIVVSPEAEAEGLEVKRDGSALGRAAWGNMMPVDPGTHVIDVTAPGRQTWTTSIDVGAGADRRTVTVPPLERLEPPPPVPEKPIVPPPRVEVRQPPTKPPPRAGLSGLRIASITSFVVGGVGVAAGAITGALALAKRNESDELCSSICTEQAYILNEDAKPLADAATATIVIGSAALVAGIVLFVVSIPSKPFRASQVPTRFRLGF